MSRVTVLNMPGSDVKEPGTAPEIHIRLAEGRLDARCKELRRPTISITYPPEVYLKSLFRKCCRNIILQGFGGMDRGAGLQELMRRHRKEVEPSCET